MAWPWRTTYKILDVDEDGVLEDTSDVQEKPRVLAAVNVAVEEEAILRAPTTKNLPDMQLIANKNNIANDATNLNKKCAEGFVVWQKLLSILCTTQI